MDIIIIAIIVWVVWSKVKNGAKKTTRASMDETAQDLLRRIENSGSSTASTSAKQPSTSPYARTVSKGVATDMSDITNPSAPIPESRPMQPRQTSSKQAQSKPESTKAAESKPAKAEEITQREGESTTEFLQRKAAADQIEHKKEKLEQKRAESRAYGNLNYALRWMEGDPVKPGYRIVKCGYCGAENMLNGQSRKYNCYFCREEL